jgi:hypothetical protein
MLKLNNELKVEGCDATKLNRITKVDFTIIVELPNWLIDKLDFEISN